MMTDDFSLETALPTHYKISDSRIWDIDAARFVTDAPADAAICELYANGQPGDAAYLRRTLDFYGKRVGLELLALDEAKAAKLHEVNTAYEAAIAALTATYPASERESFYKQESEARTWMADPESATPFVDALASGRQMDKADLMQRIIAKAVLFSPASGYLTGQRQRYEDMIDAAQTLEEVTAIMPEYIMPEAV